MSEPDLPQRYGELARLVSEERSECRDDGHESGINEVLNHCLDVFVCGGRFLVEEIALLRK